MDGKVCLVTGTSSGIGKAIAIKLAAMGAMVVMVCRDRGRGEATLYEVKKIGGSEAVELMIADLSSQESIRGLVTDFKRTHTRLDVLINNAGVNRAIYSKTVDGIETTLAVNYLAPFLFTNLLLDMMKCSAPSRIVNITGWAGALNIDDLNSQQQYNGMRVYQQSQTARIMFTREVARRLNGQGVTVNSVSPGFVRTALGRDAKGLFKIFLSLMRPVMLSPEKGAETPIYVASSAELEGVTGRAFANKKALSLPPYD